MSDQKKDIRYRSAVVWELHGPAGSPELDSAVTAAVEMGLGVDWIAAGSYRVGGGPSGVLEELADYLRALELPGVGLRFEQPPSSTRLSFRLRPDREPARFAIVHGANQPERFVTRAIEAGLHVRCVGIKRFHISGQSRQHVAWIQNLFEVTRARALEIMGATEDQIAREDAPAPVPDINVHLPVREAVSVIDRDHLGDIVKVTQTERDKEA